MADNLFLGCLQENDTDKLKHEEVDEDKAHEHPDVQVRNVADFWDRVSDSAEHGCQGEDGGHGQGHSSRNSIGRYVE